MTKQKHGPALFDLLATGDRAPSEALKLPTWSGSSVNRRIDDEEAEVAVPDQIAADVGVLDPRSASLEANARFFELDGDRIRVSFTSVSAAATCFVLFLVLLGAYEIGARSGSKAGFQRGLNVGRGLSPSQPESESEIEAARKQSPAVRLIRGLLRGEGNDAVEAETPAKKERNPVQEAQWIRGLTYIVAQGFRPGHDDDAARAKRYLAEHDVPTALVKFPSGALQLITTRGYNRSDPKQRKRARDDLKKVHAVGKMYFADGGGYKLDGYFKTRREDAW